MVSTRGGKVKFSEGERVLCYEPDPTKAKVLYDSKVLQVIHNKDLKGRKNVEYLIHFQGWNATWDRRVTEDFVLKYTDENRELQKELAEKAHIKLSIKSNRVLFGSGSSINHKKRKRRLSETIRETIERERKNRADSDTSSKTGATDGTDDDMASLLSEAGSSNVNEDENESMEGECEDGGVEEGGEDNVMDKDSGLTVEESIAKDIPLSFPESLKAILVKDYYQINEKNKLVNLPSEKPVLSILEDYVKFFALRYLTRTSERRKSDIKDKDKVYITLDLCKEFVEGIRICFDFYLHTLLLYGKERNQAEKMKKVSPFKIEKKQDISVTQPLIKESTKELHLPPEEVRETRNHHKLEKDEKKATSETTPRRILRSQRPASEDISSPLNASHSSVSTIPNSISTPSASGADGKENSFQRHHQNQSQSCESGRSTPSTITSGGSALAGPLQYSGENLPPHLEVIAQDLRSWTLLPDDYHIPPPPVLIYGSIHLLRLFVKLPEILYRMNIVHGRKKILLHHMDMFLEYLNSHSQPYFSDINYVNNTEV